MLKSNELNYTFSIEGAGLRGGEEEKIKQGWMKRLNESIPLWQEKSQNHISS